jgi:DnaA family protein
MAVQLPVQFEFRANQSFEDFYPGDNQEVVDQLKATASGKGELLIFLWGGYGFGKSHLLQACCQTAYQQTIPAFYLDLATSVIDPSLFDGLDDYPIVCLDNVNAVAGQDELEPALFNFFNAQRERNNRLILSASCAPYSLAFSLADLRTRMSWGLSLKIQPLSDDDKATALIQKAKRMGFEIAPRVARFLLTHYDRDLASLWLMLEKLDWASLAAQRRLTIPFLKEVLANRN